VGRGTSSLQRRRAEGSIPKEGKENVTAGMANTLRWEVEDFNQVKQRERGGPPGEAGGGMRQ